MLWNLKLSHKGSGICIQKKCSGLTCSNEADEKVTLDGDVIEKMAKLLYFRDVLSS